MNERDEDDLMERERQERAERAWERGEHIDRQEELEARRETMRYINKAMGGE